MKSLSPRKESEELDCIWNITGKNKWNNYFYSNSKPQNCRTNILKVPLQPSPGKHTKKDGRSRAHSDQLQRHTNLQVKLQCLAKLKDKKERTMVVQLNPKDSWEIEIHHKWLNENQSLHKCLYIGKQWSVTQWDSSITCSFHEKEKGRFTNLTPRAMWEEENTIFFLNHCICSMCLHLHEIN